MIKFSKTYPNATPEQLKESVVSAYLGLGKTGRQFTIREIATKLQVSYCSVHRTLIQSGVVLRRKGLRQRITLDSLRRCYNCGGELKVKYFITDNTRPSKHGYICKRCDAWVKNKSVVVTDE